MVEVTPRRALMAAALMSAVVSVTALVAAAHAADHAPTDRPTAAAINTGASPTSLLPPRTVVSSVLPGTLTPPPATSAAPPTRTAPAVAAETPTAWLTSARLGLRHVSIFDRGLSRDHQMLIAPGASLTHYALSAPLGAVSNSVLYGHDDVDGSILRHLDRLVPGDVLLVERPSGTALTYVVTGRQITRPNDLTPLQPSSQHLLTLFSCYPYLVDTERLVVTAQAINTPEGS